MLGGVGGNMFRNRAQAAALLAERLGHLRGLRPVILGVSPGGLLLGRSLADALGGELDVLVLRGAGAAIEPLLEVEPSHGERLHSLLGERPPADLRGRVVIIVDEGACSGGLVVAAIRAARVAGAARVIVALPVVTPAALAALRAETGEVVTLFRPLLLDAVASCYSELPAVPDAELLLALSSPPPRPRLDGAVPPID